MKFLTTILFIIFIITIIPSVSASNLENQELNLRDKSQTHSIILEFIDDDYDRFLKKNVPVIDNGLLQIKGLSIPLDFKNTKTKMFGQNSFSIKSKYFILYGNLESENYRMYFFDGKLNKVNFEKFSLSKTIATPSNKTPILNQTISKTIPPEKQELKQMVIAEKHPLLGYLENTYSFTIKAFSAEQNPNKDFSSSNGLLTNFTITGKIKDSQGKVVHTITGNSNPNNGIFQGNWYVPYLAKMGQHTLEVQIFSNGYLPVTKSMTFFVDFPYISDGNSTGP